MRALLLFFFVLAVVGAAHQEPLLVRGKQRRWTAGDLRAHHQAMRKTHKNYVPSYPAAPILTPITIGTPLVDYLVSMESGTEAIFVLAKDYPGRNTSINQPFFDPAQSSTAEFAGNYAAFSGKFELFGTSYDDVVGLFGFGEWYNTTQRFGVVNAVDDWFDYDPSLPDGVVGLSWNPENAANPNENSSAILNLFKELGPDYPRYWCQYIHETSAPVQTVEYEMMTEFGGCLDAYCEQPTATNTLPLVWLEDTRSLAFQVDSFTYKGQQYAGGFGKVDTGVPDILLPTEPFVAIYKDVETHYNWDYYLYTVDCLKAGTLPDWTFTIGGRNYSIPSTHYVVDLQLPDGQCAWSTNHRQPDTTDFVFGYVFHDIWCVKMDVDNQAISLLHVL